MSPTLLFIAIMFAITVAGLLVFFSLKGRREIKAAKGDQASSNTASAAGSLAPRQLQLQAYERLILLIDRIALPNVIARVNTPELSKSDMHMLLTQSIRQEFEHNITQQIYVTAEAWDAVRNYKEQNLLIVNQIASFLPEEASGGDLNKALLDLLVQNPKASLQNIVSEALSYEAKKLM